MHIIINNQGLQTVKTRIRLNLPGIFDIKSRLINTNLFMLYTLPVKYQW